jgi:hypothetical protein
MSSFNIAHVLGRVQKIGCAYIPNWWPHKTCSSNHRYIEHGTMTPDFAITKHLKAFPAVWFVHGCYKNIQRDLVQCMKYILYHISGVRRLIRCTEWILFFVTFFVSFLVWTNVSCIVLHFIDYKLQAPTESVTSTVDMS